MTMRYVIEKQLKKVEKQEQKYLKLTKKNILQQKTESMTNKIEQKIPEKLKTMLEDAFYKGFLIVFEKATAVIEKTYDKEKMIWEHKFQDNRFKERGKRKQFRQLEAGVKKANAVNMAVTAVEGAGLGLLGIGLPDIPIFLGVILKGIYETALRFGFDYSDKKEQIYILRLIRGAMAEEEQKKQCNELIEKTEKEINENIAVPYDFKEEVKKTSQALSQAMLVAKFIQGLPIVGVTGSGYNVFVYHKILKYCHRKYKRRYLIIKQMENKVK